MSSIHEFLINWDFKYLPVPNGGDPKYMRDGIEVVLRYYPSPVPENNCYKLIDRRGNMVSQIPNCYSQLTGYCLLGVRVGRPIFCGFISEGKRYGLGKNFAESHDSYIARYENDKLVSVLFRISRESKLFSEITLDGNLLYVELVNDQMMIHGVRYEYENNKISRAIDLDKNYTKMLFKGDKVEVYTLNGDILYKGEYLDNVLVNYCYHGQGEQQIKKNLKYQGNFEFGKRKGMGMLYRNKVLLYKGNWEDNCPQGEGTLYDDQGGVVYNGTFRRGFYETADQVLTHYLSGITINGDSVSQKKFSSSVHYSAQPEKWWWTGLVQQFCEEITAQVKNPLMFTCSLVGVNMILESYSHHLVKYVSSLPEFKAVFRYDDAPNVRQSVIFKFSPPDLLQFPEFFSKSIEKIIIYPNLFLRCRSFVLNNLPLLQEISVERNCFSEEMDFPYNLKFEISQLPRLEKIEIRENSFCHFNYCTISGRSTWMV